MILEKIKKQIDIKETEIYNITQEIERLKCACNSYIEEETYNKCYLCDTENSIFENHHILMNNIGFGTITREELTITLCRNCHNQLHVLYRRDGLQDNRQEEKDELYRNLVEEYVCLKHALKIYKYLKQFKGR